jgi:hypothetical protein
VRNLQIHQANSQTKKTSKLGSFPSSQSQQQKNETLNSKSIKSGKICNFSKHTAKALEVIHE